MREFSKRKFSIIDFEAGFIELKPIFLLRFWWRSFCEKSLKLYLFSTMARKFPLSLMKNEVWNWQVELGNETTCVIWLDVLTIKKKLRRQQREQEKQVKGCEFRGLLQIQWSLITSLYSYGFCDTFYVHSAWEVTTCTSQIQRWKCSEFSSCKYIEDANIMTQKYCISR